jgi:hypothetical protein
MVLHLLSAVGEMYCATPNRILTEAQREKKMVIHRNKWAMAGAALLIAAGALCGSASATTVQIYVNSLSDSLGGGTYGGQFTAVASPYSSTSAASALSSLNNAGLAYSSLAISQGNGSSKWGFDTFCLQESVFVNNGATDTYTISQTNSLTPDGPLTIGAAWLYNEFATGKLGTAAASYGGFSYSGANSQTDNNELQNAIWYLQDGQAMQNGYNLTTKIDPLLTLAEAEFGSGSPTHQVGAFGMDPDGEYAEVMLLTTVVNGQTVNLQDQLILAGGGGQGSGSVPDGGATVCLLGLAFAGIALMRRKLSI